MWWFIPIQFVNCVAMFLFKRKNVPAAFSVKLCSFCSGHSELVVWGMRCGSFIFLKDHNFSKHCREGNWCPSVCRLETKYFKILSRLSYGRKAEHKNLLEYLFKLFSQGNNKWHYFIFIYFLHFITKRISSKLD